MSIYKIEAGKIQAIERTTFEQQGLKERQDLQKMLKQQIDIISPNTLVVAEEFGDWEDSRKRIDLLGIDKDASLIVIELKRTEDGGHMELQAVRYAAMVSTLTFDKLVDIYASYLRSNNSDLDAAESLLEFLEWNEPDEDQFAQEVKIVLASAEFSKELTTSVMWLNDFGLDIRCVRMHPYFNSGETLLDIQTVIPIPESADYQIRIREKKQKERQSRISTKDLTKFDIGIGEKTISGQSKRWMMFHIVSAILRQGHQPDQIADCIPWRKNRLFKVFDGTLSADDVQRQFAAEDPGGKIPKHKRYFTGENEVFHHEEKTYVLTNQWGDRTLEAVESLINTFRDVDISVEPSDS